VDVEGPKTRVQPFISGALSPEPCPSFSLKVTLNLLPAITVRGGMTVNDVSADADAATPSNNVNINNIRFIFTLFVLFCQVAQSIRERLPLVAGAAT
jgi:hypothetical protein